MDPRCAPQRVFATHLGNLGADIMRDWWAPTCKRRRNNAPCGASGRSNRGGAKLCRRCKIVPSIARCR